jgi:hypothetical protein
LRGEDLTLLVTRLVTRSIKIISTPYRLILEKIDDKIERWVKEFSKLKTHDFDEFTALENLKKLKLLHPTETGLYRAKILDLAIHDLERIVSTEIVKSVYSTKDELEWNQLVEKRPFSELYR